MAFIVEDGTGQANSTSYAEVSFADTYHSDRQNGAWASATTQQKESALIKASDFIDRHFEFVSQKLNEQQSLKFPRLQPNFVPIEVQKATATYALFALSDNLYSSERTTIVGEVKRQKSKVKAGEVERETDTEFHGSGSVTVHQDSQFDAIKFLLAEFIIEDHTQTAQRTATCNDKCATVPLRQPIMRQRS